MITQFKIFENVNGWTLDKIRTQLGLGDNQTLNPMNIKYNPENKELYDNIRQYFCWKYNIDYCDIVYFFNNEAVYFGVKVVDENSVTYLPIMHKNDVELCNFLNDPEMFTQMNKYNL